MKACEAVHILRMIQDECEKQHMDGEAEALQMGIQALSAQPDHSGDVNGKVDPIDRQAAIDALVTPRVHDVYDSYWDGRNKQYQKDIDAINALPSVQPEWIPVKTRPMTDEERDYWIKHYDYDLEYQDAVMFDCKMPEDNQPVWVQSRCGYVYEDVCENDDGMIGLEENGDWNDIVAWMPKYVPEPWRGEEE